MGGEIFSTCPDRSWGTYSFLYNGYRVFPEVKRGRGVTLTPQPLPVPWSWKGRALPLLPLWTVRPVQNLSACKRVTFNLPQCLYKGALYLTSVPVQGCTLPYLSACTKVQFTLPQCLYKGALYLTSVPVQRCTLPYLSACTRATFTYFTLDKQIQLTPLFKTAHWNVNVAMVLWNEHSVT